MGRCRAYKAVLMACYTFRFQDAGSGTDVLQAKASDSSLPVADRLGAAAIVSQESSVAQTLLDDDSQSSPASSPGLSPISTPPTSASPGTSDNPLSPIEAYCLPFVDDAGTGCLLKVTDAAAGSTVLFHLTSSTGQRANVAVALAPTESFAYQRFYIADSAEHQALFTGSVEYEGRPEQRWAVIWLDTADNVVAWKKMFRQEMGRTWYLYRTLVTFHNGSTTTLFSYVPDDKLAEMGAMLRMPSPPPPSPPPPACPSPPIDAYCIPIRDGDGSGCLLKVAMAKAGSSVLFNLVSTYGEPLKKWVTVSDDATYAYEYAYLDDSRRGNANFTGWVGYLDESRCSWPVKMYDPSATYTFMGMLFPVWHWSVRWEKFQVEVPMPNGHIETTYTFCIDRMKPDDLCH